MAVITDIQGLSDGNQILGTFPELTDSKIVFKGTNNILYCEPGVKIVGSELLFKNDNSLIYLRSSMFPYLLNLKIGNDMVFHMGKNTYINSTLNVYLSEQRHCIIGDYCLFAPAVTIRNADPHLIYDCETKARINPTHSVYIGDHVWLGQDAMILKGTQIDSGSIVGGCAVVSGKKIPHNTIWAGNPAKQLKEGIFWDHSSVHEWKEQETKASQNYDNYIELYPKSSILFGDGRFTYEPSETLEFDQIDQTLNELKTSQERYEYLIHLNSVTTRNRFVHS